MHTTLSRRAGSVRRGHETVDGDERTTVRLQSYRSMEGGQGSGRKMYIHPMYNYIQTLPRATERKVRKNARFRVEFLSTCKRLWRCACPR